jgi:hypothetical protein
VAKVAHKWQESAEAGRRIQRWAEVVTGGQG